MSHIHSTQDTIHHNDSVFTKDKIKTSNTSQSSVNNQLGGTYSFIDDDMMFPIDLDHNN